jgi:Xaa-Pro aminopeptidase
MFAPSSLPSWSDRRLEEGDLWHADMYGVWHGYLFDFSRTTVAGRPSSAQLELLEAPVAIVEDVIAALRPGLTFAEAAAVGADAKRRIAGDGPSKGAGQSRHDYPHFGHTIGLGWENLWLYPGERRTLEPGMHVAVETSVGRPELGFAMFEQNLLITETGIELTSRCEPRWWARGRL